VKLSAHFTPYKTKSNPKKISETPLYKPKMKKKIRVGSEQGRKNLLGGVSMPLFQGDTGILRGLYGFIFL